MAYSLSGLGDRLLSLLYPKTCFCCGGVVEYDSLLCNRCVLPRLARTGCPVCGKEKRSCVCGRVAWRFTLARSPFRYGGIQAAIVTLKDYPDRRIAGFFGREMAACLEAEGNIVPDWVVPVPMNPKKRRRRGHNQARLLADAVAAELGLPLREALFQRFPRIAQHKIGGWEERMENAMRAYELLPEAGLAGKKILLVDDVLTTGATAHACSTRLADGGAAAVYVLTAASTHLE